MSVFVSKTLRKFPYTSDSYVSSRGAVRIIAAGNSGTVQVFKETLSGVSIPVFEGDVTCKPSLEVDVPIGSGEHFYICVNNGECVVLDAVDVNYTSVDLDLAALAANISDPIISAISSQTTDDYEFSTMELCQGNEIFVQGLVSINGGAPANVGAPIATGKACGLGEYIGQICYEPNSVPVSPVLSVVGSGASGGNADMAYFNADSPDFQWIASFDGQFGGVGLRFISTGVSPLVLTVTNTNTGMTSIFDGVPSIGQGITEPNAILDQDISYSAGDLITFDLTFKDTTGYQWRNSDPTNPGNEVFSWSRPGQINEAGANLFTVTRPEVEKRMAYGLREPSGAVTYYDVETNQVLTPGSYMVCPVETEPDAPIVSVPDGEDIPNNSTYTFPVSQVRTFTVFREGAGNVQISFASGRTFTVDRNGSRTFGNGDAAQLLDVSGVTITTGDNSRAEVTWENV